jgi:fatty acid desaturase
MAAAARVKPRSLFDDEEWSSLTRRAPWMGPLLITHCWAMIALAWAMALAWPVTLPLAVMIVGGRQLGLAILMHDAAHGALHPDPKANDWLARVFCDPVLDRYRPYHLTHHRFAQQDEDPDLVLSAPFPITPTSLRRKMIRDLTGQTFLKQRFGMLAAPDSRAASRPSFVARLSATLKQRRRMLIGGAVTTAILIALDLLTPIHRIAPLGVWWGWLALWLLPSATWLPLVTRLRNIAEHALVAKNEPDPMRHARTTKANLIERALVAPYWVNYHCEHHMFMHLPCYRLPRAHRMLAAKGVTPSMEVADGYMTVLRLAASRPDRIAA